MRKLLAALGFLFATPALAAARPVVLELFTSQSCSSCPPADALLADLAASDPGILALDFHVDYWNYLSWHDHFSLPAATARQRAYAVTLGAEIYTPQLVIDGKAQAVGSDRGAVTAAIRSAREAPPAAPTLELKHAGGQLEVMVGAGTGHAHLLLVGFDPMHVTQVGAGENAGRTLTEINVVRGIVPLGNWSGAPLSLAAANPGGTRAALLLQAADGAILNATTE